MVCLAILSKETFRIFVDNKKIYFDENITNRSTILEVDSRFVKKNESLHIEEDDTIFDIDDLSSACVDV